PRSKWRWRPRKFWPAGLKPASTLAIQQQAPTSVVFYEFSFVAGEGIVERFNESVGVDECFLWRPLFPPRFENFFLLHLVQRFVVVHGFLHTGGSLFQHFCEGANVVEVGE